ncbi:MAG TPA: RusA family crossover junction endodeoxyribonuclease [Treponemataceae bacterium]|nr:RusA family crossover junction endodeoxyribonuclease [Treponemataceae bacterium]
MIKFVVLGKPYGKQRPRFSNGRVYNPPRNREYEKWVQLNCRMKYKGNPITEPVIAEITAYYPIPKSYTKKQRQAILQGELLPTVKPDADNIEKAIYDALNGIAYIDDSQIIDQRCRKVYAIDGKPRVEVSIRAYNAQERQNNQKDRVT